MRPVTRNLVLLACLLCVASALAEPEQNIVWNNSGDHLIVRIDFSLPGMHGALAPFEPAALREGEGEPGWTPIWLISPAGDFIPALAPSQGLETWEKGDASRIAVVNNPDPADRLNLRRLPDQGSASRG